MVPDFGPTLALETPLTLSSAACTFFEHPEAHLRPVTSRVTVFSSSATATNLSAVTLTAGAPKAPAVKAATAAIIANVVFMVFFLSGRFIPTPRRKLDVPRKNAPSFVDPRTPEKRPTFETLPGRELTKVRLRSYDFLESPSLHPFFKIPDDRSASHSPDFVLTRRDQFYGEFQRSSLGRPLRRGTSLVQ